METLTLDQLVGSNDINHVQLKPLPSLDLQPVKDQNERITLEAMSYRALEVSTRMATREVD